MTSKITSRLKGFNALSELARSAETHRNALAEIAKPLKGFNALSELAQLKTQSNSLAKLAMLSDHEVSQPALNKLHGRFTKIAPDFAHSFQVRDRHERKSQVRQLAFLQLIAETNRTQNEIMAQMVKQQDLLIHEALENSRIQRIVLWFTALGATLALVALFVHG